MNNKVASAFQSFKDTHNKKNRNNQPYHQVRVNNLDQREFAEYVTLTEKWASRQEPTR